MMLVMGELSSMLFLDVLASILLQRMQEDGGYILLGFSSKSYFCLAVF